MKERSNIWLTESRGSQVREESAEPHVILYVTVAAETLTQTGLCECFIS